MQRIGIIGGTGFGEALVAGQAQTIETEFGPASVTIGPLGADRELVFVARHGTGHKIPPHRINHRANITALRQMGVGAVYATAAVGSLQPDIKPGDFVVLDDFLDLTQGAVVTFFDEPGTVRHTDMSQPYHPDLRRLLLATGDSRETSTVHPGGTYVCLSGPRYETPAEIRLYASWGGAVVGMTSAPEAILCREAALPYAGVAIVTNYGCGLVDAAPPLSFGCRKGDDPLPRAFGSLAAPRRAEDGNFSALDLSKSTMLIRDARVPLVLIALALAALTVWSLRYFGRYQPFAELTKASLSNGLDRVSLQVQNATIVGRVNGKRRWRVSCGAITLSRDRRQVVVDGIHDGTLYDSAQQAVVAVSAAHATYSAFGQVFGDATPAQGVLRLTGGIRATLSHPRVLTLQTDGLTWDALRSEIACADTVTAQTKGGMAQGQGLTVDTRSGDLTLLRLHGNFLISLEGPPPMIRTAHARSALMAGSSLALLAPVGAAPATTAAPQYVTYDAGFSRWLNAPRTVEMSQGVTFNQDDSHLKTQAAIVNLDDQQRALNAKSQVPVHLYNTQDDLTGSEGFVDFTRHLATLENNIVLVVKPGAHEAGAPPGSLRSRFKDPATLTCDKLTYDYRAKIAHIPGPLTVHSGGRVLTADSGTYEAGTQIVTLIGHVHGTSGENEIDAPHATINIREGQESVTIDAPTHGRMPVKDDTNGDAPTASSATTPPPDTASSAPKT